MFFNKKTRRERKYQYYGISKLYQGNKGRDESCKLANKESNNKLHITRYSRISCGGFDFGSF